ncbi:unnamed protein product [Ixodes persulcatus]
MLAARRRGTLVVHESGGGTPAVAVRAREVERRAWSENLRRRPGSDPLVRQTGREAPEPPGAQHGRASTGVEGYRQGHPGNRGTRRFHTGSRGFRRRLVTRPQLQLQRSRSSRRRLAQCRVRPRRGTGRCRA